MNQSFMDNRASQFIETVLALKPKLAVFDCDGTLWNGDSGRDFFYWEIDRGIVSRDVADAMLERYRLYDQRTVSELAMCGEMVTMHGGLAVQGLYQAAKEFFEEVVAARIFPEMQNLTQRLAESECEVWAVSSTNNWVVEAGSERFGIPPERVLAACIHVEDGTATNKLSRVPTDELKALVIRELIGQPIDAVFGNSIHDQAMLEIAQYPFCVNPNPDLELIARERDWPIYWPEGILREKA